MVTQTSYSRADQRLAIIAGASVLVAVIAAIAGWAGIMPSAAGSIVAIIGVTIALRVAWSYAASSASSSARAKTTALISSVGLGVSGVTLLATLPRITQLGGVPLMLADLCAQLWTLGILTLLSGASRTFGWRVFAGMFLTGFLALAGIARFIGRPIIENLGETSPLAVGLLVPLAEEFAKFIPIAIVLFIALRKRDARPSALDIMLVGAWCGAGFAVYENATFGRGLFSLTQIPVLSLAFPMSGSGGAFGWPLAQTGHLNHTALNALGVAFALFYRTRIKRAWIAAPVAIGATLLEHCSQNAMVVNGLPEFIGKATIVLSLDGYLASTLLFLGVIAVAILEWPAVAKTFSPMSIVHVNATLAATRSRCLAVLQSAGSIA